MMTLFSIINESRAERPCGRHDSTGVLAIGTFAFERTSLSAALAGRASRNGTIHSSVRNAEAEKSAAHMIDAYCGTGRELWRWTQIGLAQPTHCPNGCVADSLDEAKAGVPAGGLDRRCAQPRPASVCFPQKKQTRNAHFEPICS
jgi:hypothetical protein